MRHDDGMNGESVDCDDDIDHTLFSYSNELSLSKWLDFDGTRIIILEVSPPRGCGQGELGVLVTEQSSNRTAVVEFSMDPDAAGPGCFTI